MSALVEITTADVQNALRLRNTAHLICREDADEWLEDNSELIADAMREAAEDYMLTYLPEPSAESMER